MIHHPDDTICAISTPAGQGGIAVIRVSGVDAFAHCNRIFAPANQIPLGEGRRGASLIFGHIVSDAQIIDEVLVSTFHAPRSYTGDDVVEISCHGSLFIQQAILKLLLNAGCRMATAGEFTLRAFLNGKIDLSQAEAVGDLIAASSSASHRVAMQHLRGGFSHELAALSDQLLDFTSLVELELDFADEDVTFADRSQLIALAGQICAIIRRLADSFSAGNSIKNGIPVAIIGATNVGKSTLLNRLVRDDKAIVSSIHGTTRDAIEDTCTINGQMFRFIDTAGIRETHDSIEQMGIERSFQKMAQASIVLWVVDLTDDADAARSFAPLVMSRCDGKRMILILNKADLLTDDELCYKTAQYGTLHDDCMVLSAQSDADISALEGRLTEAACLPQVGGDEVIVTNVRHYEALVGALAAIERVTADLTGGVSADLLALDIRTCIAHLNEITGKQITADDVLGNIFGKFCIGK